MKKLFKSLLVVACVGAIGAGVAAMAACGGGETGVKGESYNITHGARFVGYSYVRVDGDKITKAYLTEVDLPAEITVTGTGATAEAADAAAKAKFKGDEADYALKSNQDRDGTFTAAYLYKTVSYNNVELTFDADAKGYVTKDGTAFTTYLLNNTDRCKEYYEAAIENKIAVTLKGEKDYTVMNKKAMSKEENGYWSKEQGGLGWKANRDNMCKYVEKNGALGLLTLTQSNEESTKGLWLDTNNVSTGATWTDMLTTKDTYESYASLMYRAYQKALENALKEAE